MLGFALLGVCVVLILYAVIVALIRGVTKSTLRLVLVIISFLLAVFLTLGIQIAAGTEQVGDTVVNSLGEDVAEKVDEFVAGSPVLEKIVLESAVAIVNPIVFMLLFIVLALVTWVLYLLIVILSFGRLRKKDKTKSSKGLKCLIIGIIQGFIITAVFMVPVGFYLDVAPEAIDEIAASSAVDAETKDSIMEIKEPLDQLNSSAAVNVYRKIGGKFLYSQFTSYSFKYNEETVNVSLKDEIKPICRIALEAIGLTKAGGIENFGEAEAESIKNIGNSFADSKLISTISAEAVKNATDAWIAGAPYANIEKPDLGEMINPLWNSVIGVLNESSNSAATLGEDVITVAELVSKLVSSGVLKNIGNSEELVKSLAADGVISGITETLSENPRMKALIPEITNLGIRALAAGLGIPANTEEVYMELMNSIAGDIAKNKELDTYERIEILKTDLAEELSAAGITVEDEDIDIIATALIEDFGDFEGEITPEFITEFFILYSEEMGGGDEGGNIDVKANGEYGIVKLGNEKTGFTYPKYQVPEAKTGATAAGKLSCELNKIAASGKTEQEKKQAAALKLGEIMGDIYDRIIEKSENSDEASKAMVGKSEQIAASVSAKTAASVSASVISSLSSSDTAVFGCVTIDKLLIPSDFSATDIKKESEAIENIVKGASVILKKASAAGEGKADIKEMTSGLGTALDALSETEMFGTEKTAELFTAVLQSKTIRDTAGISVTEASEIAGKVAESSYSSVMNVVSGTVSVVEEMLDNGITEDSIRELISSLTPETAAVISSVVTADRMKTVGLSGENAETSAHLISTLFGKLADIENEEDYAKETKAVKQLLEIGLGATHHTEGASGLFGESGFLGCTADEMVSTVMASEAVKTTLGEAVGGESGKKDPFGLRKSVAASEINKLLKACNDFSANTASDKKQAVNKSLGDIAALFGVDWTPGMYVPEI